MTIITVFDAERRQERGWDSPNYPIASWKSGSVISHDASGGAATAQINLATADVPEGLAYSMEYFFYETSANTNVDVIVRPTNFDTSALSLGQGFQMADVGGALAGLAMVLSPGLQRPRFLGVVVDRTIAAAISISAKNVTGKTSVFNIGGYVWGPRAVLQGVGGYRRPPDGMFGI